MSRSPFSLFRLLTLFALIVLGCIADIRAQSLSAQRTSQSEAIANLITEGVNALERNDLAEARSKFLKAIEANPKDATAYIYLGIIDDRSGDFKGAEARFAAAVKADPRSPAAH